MGDILYQEYQLSRIEKVFTIFVVFLPILQYYKSPVSIFNMATFLAVVFLVLFLVHSKGIIGKNKRLLPIIIYAIFVTINMIVTSSMYNYSLSSNILDYLRTMLLIVSILFFGSTYFDTKYAISIMEKLLIASAGFMIIQLFFYYVLHHPITGNIPALVTNAGYKTASNRATGFYMEPAAYAQSAILYLCFKLFGKEKIEKGGIKKILIIIMGVLMSGSGQGYAFLAVVIAMWLLYNFFFESMTLDKIMKGIIIVAVIIIGVYIVIQTSYGQYVLSRIVSDEASSVFDSLGGSALSGRTYTNKLFYSLSEIEKFWGVGFGRSKVVVGKYYINSLYFYLIECGYISLVVWGMMLLLTFIRGDLHIKVYTLVYIIMIYFTGCAKPMMLCFYFMFLLMGNDNLNSNYSVSESEYY